MSRRYPDQAEIFNVKYFFKSAKEKQEIKKRNKSLLSNGASLLLICKFGSPIGFLLVGQKVFFVLLKQKCYFLQLKGTWLKFFKKKKKAKVHHVLKLPQQSLTYPSY